MALFGRRARRRAPAVGALWPPAPADCTAAVLGGLWPTELDDVRPATAHVADDLRRDLARIVHDASVALHSLSFSWMPEEDRRRREARIIRIAREFAVKRVEEAIAALHRSPPARPDVVIAEPVAPAPAPTTSEDAITLPLEPPKPQVSEAQQRLHDIGAYLSLQAPGLRWAVGERDGGTTLVVTDAASGWIPPGILLPDDVELLSPARRGGDLAALLGPCAAFAIYDPHGDPPTGDSSRVAQSSDRPLRLPLVSGLSREIERATESRAGLLPMTHAVAWAVATGNDVAADDVEKLQQELDAVVDRLIDQYPEPQPELVLNCMLLAGTERLASRDFVTANYHFAWFRALDGPRRSKD